MVFDGYLEFGGNEIVNSERARGYARTADCPMTWLKDEACTTLPDMLGDGSYNYVNISQAPWYDPALADLSSRFFGLYGLSISDVNTSTRSAQLSEGVDDGGVIGRTRKGPKRVKVRAMLMAKGSDALEYGHEWLNAALDPGACGQHGTGCGTTDTRFLTTCPPARRTIPYYSDWAIQQTNLLTNPSFETPGAPVVVRTNLNSNPRHASSSTGWTTTGPTATLTATANGTQVDVVTGPTSVPLIFNSADLAVANGDRAVASAEVTVPAGFPAVPLKLVVYAYGQNVPIADGGSVTVQPGTTVTLTAPAVAVANASATGMRTIIYGGTGGAPTGARFVVRNVLTEKALTPGPYFDGQTQAVLRTNWIRNSSFETDASLWTVTNAATITRTTVQSHRGAASLQVVTAGTTSGEGVYSSTYTVPGMAPGMPYAGSIWVLAPAGATMEALANTLGTGGTVATVSFTGTGAWQLVSMPGNLANGGLTPYIIVRTRSTAQAITFYVDEALLETGVSTPGIYFDTTTAPQGYATAWTGAANASATILWDADFSTRWQGPANASASELTGIAVAGLSTANAFAVQSTRWTKAGAKSARIIPSHPTNTAYAEISPFPMTVNGTYTGIVTMHLEAPLSPAPAGVRTRTVNLLGGNTTYSNTAPNAAGDTELRVTGSITNANGRMIFFHDGVQGSGDIWVDLATLIAGTYTGPAFTGSSTPADTSLQRYRWTGATDASTSVYETRTILERPQTDEEYAADWMPTVRYLHDTAATDGPYERDLMESNGFWAQIVEWTITSERPWVFGESKQVTLPTTPSFVVEDVRYNRVPYPSMELAGTTNVPVQYNLSPNPSVEVNATSWSARSLTGIAAGQFTGARTTELAAQGLASYRIQVLGSATATAAQAGSVDAYQDVTLSAVPRTRYSINVWAALIKIAGNANNVLTSTVVQIDWLNSGGTSLGITTVGTGTGAALNGNVFQMRGILPPAGAVTARVIVRGTFTWEPGNATPTDRADIRLYADALALSIP